MKEKKKNDSLDIDFGFTIRPLVNLSTAMSIVKEKRIMDPVPSRPTFIKMIRSGVLEGKLLSSSNHWYVYEDSLINLAKKLSENDPSVKF